MDSALCDVQQTRIVLHTRDCPGDVMKNCGQVWYRFKSNTHVHIELEHERKQMEL